MDAFRFSTTDHLTRSEAALRMRELADQLEHEAAVHVRDGDESAVLAVPDRVFMMERVEIELDEYEVEIRVFW